MSTLALLVMLLLILAGLIVIGGLAYVVHRRPALAQPLTVALAGATVLAAIVLGIVQTTNGG